MQYEYYLSEDETRIITVWRAAKETRKGGVQAELISDGTQAIIRSLRGEVVPVNPGETATTTVGVGSDERPEAS